MTDYCVRNGGIDTATGLTDATAWATAAKAFAAAKLPGDTVAFKCGSLFPEILTIKGAGNTTSPLTVTSYGTGPRPIISAADIPPLWVIDQAVAGGNRWKVVPGFSPGFLHREDGVIGAGLVRNLMKRATLATCVALHDWFSDGTTLYVVVASSEVPNANGLTIHATRRVVCVNEAIDGQDYITIKNLHCRFSLDGGFYGCIHIAANSMVNTGWTVDNVLTEWGGSGVKFGGQGSNSFAQGRVLTMTNSEHRFHREHGAQLIFLTDGSRIEDTSFHGNGRMGLGIAMRNGVVNRCRFDQNASVLNLWTIPVAVQGFDHALDVVGQEPNNDRASGNLVSDCTATGNGKAGFAVDALCDGTTYLRCIATNNFRGWYLEGGTFAGATGTKLYHCNAYGNAGAGVTIVNTHGPFDARNCQFGGNGTTGNSEDVYIEWSLTQWAPQAGEIYKHTHVNYDPVALSQDNQTVLTRVANLAALTARGQWTHDPVGETVYVRKTDGTQPSICWMDPAYTLDGNNYTPAGSLPAGNAIVRVTKAGSTNRQYTTIAALRAGEGKETNGQQVNPLYVAPPADLHLSAGSPSRGAGVQVLSVSPNPHPDIGAYPTMPASSTPPTDAGSYTVVATVTDPNYTGSATGTLVISKSAATVVLGNLTQAYNGTPRPVSVVTTPPGLTTTVTYDAAA